MLFGLGKEGCSPSLLEKLEELDGDFKCGLSIIPLRCFP
jgi:hypothetical protein